MKNLIVDIHIEKTAGTSRAVLYDKLFKLSEILKYNPTKKKFYLLSEYKTFQQQFIYHNLNKIKPLFAKYPLFGQFCYKGYWKLFPRPSIYTENTIPPQTKVFSGHIFAKEAFKIFRNAQFVSLLRDPFKRTVSHYKHWKLVKGGINWIINIPYRDDFTFEEFAFHPKIINLQTQRLIDINLNKFSFLATVNDFKSYEKWLTGRNGTNIKTNKAVLKDLSEYLYNKAFLDKFKDKYKDDYSLYNKILENPIIKEFR